MSDTSHPVDSTSAPSTSKQPQTRFLRQLPIPRTESGRLRRPKSFTAKRVEAEGDRPRNLLPTTHTTHTANFKPDPDDPKDVLRRSTERNAPPSPFTFPISCASRRVVNDTAGVACGPQPIRRRAFIEHRQHLDYKSIVEYWPPPLGDPRRDLPADDATPFLRPPRPQIAVEQSGEPYTENGTVVEFLLTARATACGKLPLLCTGVMSLLLRVQPPQTHCTILRVLRTDSTKSCTIKFRPRILPVHLRSL
jgi:hypothetical protein